MRYTSGLLTEGVDTDGTKVVRMEKGDILFYRGEYLQIDGFFKSEMGNLCMRLGIPKDREQFRLWGQRNPHKVKRLETYTTIIQ